jgi:DNA-binding FrmR family transcriptional regulator
VKSNAKKSKKAKVDFPDHTDELSRLRKVTGQISGIEKMILSRRYCPDILQQIRAARSALAALELTILKTHISMCLKDSARGDSQSDFERKLKELLGLIKG